MNRHLITFNTIAILIALTLTHSAQASTFTGFHASVNFGYENANIKNNNIFTLNVDPIESLIFQKSPRLTDASLTGGVAFGYTKMLQNKYVLGIEGRANFESISPKLTDISSNTNPNGLFSSISYVSAQLKNDVSLLLKAGITPASTSLIYVVAGPTFGKFDIHTSQMFQQSIQGVPFNATGAATSSRSSYQTGLLGGLGFEYLLTANASASLEYSYVCYGRLNYTKSASAPLAITGVPLTGSIATQNTIDASTNSILLRYTYYFG